jgi:spermidine synthase
MACQGMLCLFLAALAFLLQVLQHWLDASARGSTDLSLIVVFAVLALIFGFLGGMHFSLAVRVLAGATVASEKIGGGLYGLDLLGAAGGALIASLFLIPLYGILTTIFVFAAFTGIGALALVPGRRTG